MESYESLGAIISFKSIHSINMYSQASLMPNGDRLAEL